MLKQRILTAWVLVTVLLLAIFVFPPFWFHAFVALVLCAGAWEWSRLAGIENALLRLLYAAAFLPLLYLLMHISDPVRDRLLLLSLFWWALAWLLVRSYPRLSDLWHRPDLLLPAGLLVLLPGWLALLYLRALEAHVLYIVLLVALVAAADTGAYFAGRRFGRHKLSPIVSPNKTWEGFAGGQLAACSVTWIFLFGGFDLGLQLSAGLVLQATLATMLLAATSVVGDLFESMLKRKSGMKDSGNLLPGHGGVLDRLDSLTAALPVYAFILLNAGSL